MLLGQVWLERFLQLVISSPPKKKFLMENFSIQLNLFYFVFLFCCFEVTEQGQQDLCLRTSNLCVLLSLTLSPFFYYSHSLTPAFSPQCVATGDLGRKLLCFLCSSLPFFYLSPHHGPRELHQLCSPFTLCMACSCLVGFPIGIRICPIIFLLVTNNLSNYLPTPLSSQSLLFFCLHFFIFFSSFIYLGVGFGLFLFFFFSEGGGRQGKDDPLV